MTGVAGVCVDADPNRSANGFVDDEFDDDDPCNDASRLLTKSELDCCEAGVNKLDRFAPPLSCASARLTAKASELLFAAPVAFALVWLAAVEPLVLETANVVAGVVTPLAFW